jgi:hypothetical protein
MAQFTLKPNQAALILEVSSDGDVNVDAFFPEEPDEAGDLAAAICTVIGRKLTEDEDFQEELMDAVEAEEE